MVLDDCASFCEGYLCFVVEKVLVFGDCLFAAGTQVTNGASIIGLKLPVLK